MLNNYRSTHGASNLTLSTTLMAKAQSQADKMCQSGSIGPIVQGQNIAVLNRGDFNFRDCHAQNQQCKDLWPSIAKKQLLQVI